MSSKRLITLRDGSDAARVKQAGCEVVAEYPDTLLVRADDAQRDALEQAGLEVNDFPEPPIRLAGTSFTFSSARSANARAPITSADPGRTAYYLVQLVGPAKREWLDTIAALGGAVHGNLPGFTLLVGVPAVAHDALLGQPWVEDVTPYRPAMKVAAALRPAAPRSFGIDELATLSLPDDAPKQQVEVTVFPGESTADVAARLRATGATILGQSPKAVVALASSAAIAELAEEQGVQAILPHAFPTFENDRATVIMGVPSSGALGGTTLRGDGEIVAVADSGLDTGDLATLHLDLRGRVKALVSFPTPASLAPYVNDPQGFDDGTADLYSAHGTHVAGSVAGNGAVARDEGVSPEPRGTAPEAHIYFQGVEQRVRWKSRQEMLAAGHQDPGPNWPPKESGLYGLPADLGHLFVGAYAGGARIHTNSWGSSDPRAFAQYNDNARAVDAFMFTHRDMLILFSAGNSGADGDQDGVIDAGSVTPPGTAKNCLTVGASESERPRGGNPPPGLDKHWKDWRWPTLPGGHVSDDPEGMAAFSSRGPTAEGRIKPDVVAPGTNILSARSSVGPTPPLWGDLPAAHPLHKKYCWSGGTSMSTPLVAGAAALVRQYLVERGHFVPGGKPSGALVKAILINGAVRMEAPGGAIPTPPNSVIGFGRVHLGETFGSADAPVLFDDEPDHGVATGEMRVFEVAAKDGARALSVTLVWTDAPGQALNGSLQNRLYLQIRTPDGHVLHGDTTAFPVVMNNVQRLRVPAPIAGTYEVRVRGVEVIVASPGATPTDGRPRQDFALVVSNATRLDYR